MILNRHTILAFLLLTTFILLTDCDTNKDDNVTGALLYREVGELKNFTLDPDSIRIETRYKYNIGEIGKTFAGQYENVTAFSVFKFERPDQSVIDSLVSATIEFIVDNVWETGVIEFGLYTTTSDWSDTTRLDPDLFLADIVTPLSVVQADTSSTSLIFDIPTDTIDSWPEECSFILTNTESGMAMVNVSSAVFIESSAVHDMFTGPLKLFVADMLSMLLWLVVNTSASLEMQSQVISSSVWSISVT